ncbi:MAG: biotin/lipoyl-binding protein [Thermodesulfobacteria bacterium]|nr:biotin/lipoyl-binding protein [Thermodesulfobacteriota bacterium]
MRSKAVGFTLLCTLALVCMFHAPAKAQVEVLEKGLKQPESCENATSITLSGVYSPYSVHLIKAEVSGRINRINAREGEILAAGTPIMEIEHTALERQLHSLKGVLEALSHGQRVLEKNLELLKRKLRRYKKLKAAGHVEEQTVEDVEAQVNNAELALIENRQRQAETKRAIWELKDRIRKSIPSFQRPLYVSQNFKELYETVVPGENLSRLLDVSKAKIHLVLSLACFKVLETRLLRDKTINFSIILPGNRKIETTGKVERLKIDPDNRYLYSYGFDLVFQPVKGLLWGQVVQIRLQP